ncbi:MAG TPA: haloacid dehalogenase type II, partial [Arenicellales bacterium]|nr:haloacid dehalogenase type II [Arenicellales bacterium]
VDFWRITGDALDYALETYAIDDPDLRADLMQAYMELDAYPEVAGVLETLRDAGFRTAILSNGSPEMLTAAVEGAGISDLLDANLSIEEVGIYKPDPRVYQLAVERLNVSPGEISFQSSNSWDAVGAATFGFRVAWVNRFGQRRERLTADPDAEIGDLKALPALLGMGG